MLNIVQSSDVFEALSSIGIAFLLFLVGLHLNWRSIKDVGLIAVLAGLGQVIFTTGFGKILIRVLGFDVATSLIAALAFAFSSTIIIVKLLTDKEDLERFYGRISVGVLIVQDLVAMAILLAVAAFGSQADSVAALVGWAVLKLVIVLIVLLFLARYVLPGTLAGAAFSHGSGLVFWISGWADVFRIWN